MDRFTANLRTMRGQLGSQNDPLLTMRALTGPDFLILCYRAPPSDLDGFILLLFDSEFNAHKVFNTDFFRKKFENHFVYNPAKI